MASNGTKQQTGFSSIELIVVMVLVSIFAVSVALRWQSGGEATVAYQIDLLARDLRHVQGLAAVQGRTLRFNVESARYCATAAPDNTCDKAITDPATSKPFIVPLQHGVTLTGTSTEFDSLGRPKDGVLLATARRFTLAADTATWSAKLLPLTGLVEVSAP